MRFQDAIAAQGRNLRQSRPLVEGTLNTVDLGAWRTGRLAFTGMGASCHSLSPVVASLLALGRPAIALAADELAPVAAAGLVDCIVAVTQGGTSTEMLELVSGVGDLPRMVITNVPESPVASYADVVIPLGLLEDSAVYTLGYTATLQALGLLAAVLCSESPDESWESLPDVVEEVLAASRDTIAELADKMATPRAVDLVGSGAHMAAAGEGALILREASRLPTSCHSTRQYLHGPMEPLDEGLLAVVVGDGREIDLALDISKTGAHALLLTTAEVAPTAHLTVIRLPDLRPTQLAILEILPIQLLASEVATRHGLAVEGFRYEQRDTKLGGSVRSHVSSAGRRVLREGSLGIDVGGSKVAVALTSGRACDVEFWDVLPTPTDGSDAVLRVGEELVERALAVARRQNIGISGIGVAVPEVVDLDGRIISHVVVPGMDAEEWVHRFEAVAPVVVESDVRAGATGEAVCGAGRSSRSFCYVSVGSGVSYCLVLNGRVHTGARGTAILLGSSVAAEWEADGQQFHWILEELASGPAMLARYVELGGDRTSPKEILKAYGQEPTATRAVKEAARSLGIGVALLVNLLDPELVVVGGGLGSAEGPFWELSVESARDHIWSDVARGMPIRQAELGARSAAVGAALIGTDSVRHRPSRGIVRQ